MGEGVVVVFVCFFFRGKLQVFVTATQLGRLE